MRLGLGAWMPAGGGVVVIGHHPRRSRTWHERRWLRARPADRFLLGIGVACVAGAIVAGGLKIANVELPVIESTLRQMSLGALGVLLVAASLLIRTRDDTMPVPTTDVDRPLMPVPGAVPSITRYFTGRPTLLAKLDQLRQSERRVVLTGLGGVGKTQLALAWLRVHRDEFEIVWCLRADREANLTVDLAAFADHQHLCDQTASLPDKLAAARHWLDHNSRWLLIFDNATNPITLEPYLPTGQGGTVVITAQERHWSHATLEVPPWPHSEAVAFLTKHSSAHPDTAEVLAELLGELPLALEQARAYLAATGRTAASYLADLRKELAGRTGGLLAAGAPAHHQETIATTWTLSLPEVHRTRGAGDLLTLLCFLAPDATPRSLLSDHLDVLPVRLRHVAGDRVALDRAIVALGRFSLITLTEQSLRVHRLVQAVIRQGLRRRQARRWAKVAVGLVAQAFPANSDDPLTWPLCADLLPHALAVTETTETFGIHHKETVAVLHRAGRYLWERAELALAASLFRRALAICEAHLGPDDPATGASLSNLGLVLYDQGDLDGARTYHERGVTIHEALLGPDHLETARSLNNLAGVLRAQGHLDGARRTHERVLAIREARLDPEHPEVANSLNNLGLALHAQRDFDRARALLERALAICAARLGPDHPTTMTTLSNLASVLDSQGDPTGARGMLERALAIREARLGPDHPDTADSFFSLAGLFEGQKDYDSARILYERALSIHEARLGPDHLETANDLFFIALVIGAQGDLQGAYPYLKRAFPIYEARLGRHHRKTTICRRILALMAERGIASSQ
jgi:tetratricopeptide (TPR) repeat protein